MRNPSARINARHPAQLTAQCVLQMLSVQCGEWLLVEAVNRILDRLCDASLIERRFSVRVAADIVCGSADTCVESCDALRL